MLLFVDSAWLTDFEQARLNAKQTNKFILLNFSGSDWCAPCINMKKKIFEDPKFQECASQSLVLVRADFPRHKKNQLDPIQQAHNNNLADRYNPKGKFPLTLLLDAEGKVVHEWDGYEGISAEDFVIQINEKTGGK